jgi:hypothetical protein
MADSRTHHSMKSIYSGRRKAVKIPPANIGPLKKGCPFGKLPKFGEQRDALDHQIKMIEAL